MFQIWFLLVMSTLVVCIYYTSLADVRMVSIFLVYPLLVFSALLGAYPASGRFLAGVRFYFIELAAIIGLTVVFLVDDDVPGMFFHKEVGNLTFSGAALCMSCLLNLLVFGLRNTYQLFRNPACLVVLATLMEYEEVGTKIVESEDDDEMTSTTTESQQQGIDTPPPSMVEQ